MAQVGYPKIWHLLLLRLIPVDDIFPINEKLKRSLVLGVIIATTHTILGET